MKTTAFHELLKSIRDAGAYLKSNSTTAPRKRDIPQKQPHPKLRGKDAGARAEARRIRVLPD